MRIRKEHSDELHELWIFKEIESNTCFTIKKYRKGLTEQEAKHIAPQIFAALEDISRSSKHFKHMIVRNSRGEEFYMALNECHHASLPSACDPTGENSGTTVRTSDSSKI